MRVCTRGHCSQAVQSNALLLVAAEKPECFVEPPQMQMAQSDDQDKGKTPVVSAPVAILAVLVVLVLFTIILVLVRALFQTLESIYIINIMLFLC